MCPVCEGDPRCTVCNGPQRKSYEVCEECKGKGRILLFNEVEYTECEECAGTGKIEIMDF